MSLIAAAVLLLIATPEHARAEGPEPYAGKVFLGLGGREVELPKDERYESTWGLALTRVAALSSGSAAGLRVGDTLVSIDGAVWKNEQIRLSRSFGKAGDKATPGEVAECLVLRRDEAEADAPRKLETVKVTLQRYPRTRRDEPRAPTNDELRPDLKDVRPAYRDVCWQLIDDGSFREDTEDLLARLDRADRFPDPDRLPLVRYVLRDPFKLEAVGREIAVAIQADSVHGAAGCRGLLEVVSHVLLTFDRRRRLADEPMIIARTYENKELDAHLDYVGQVLQSAAEWQMKAFAALSADEAKYIRDHRLELLEAFIEYKMLSYDEDREAQERYLPILDLAGKVDLGALTHQARVASLLVAPEFTESLRKAAEKSGKNLEAPVIAQRKTPLGLVVVAGRGRNRHTGQSHAAIFDLGGDDVYANNQATPVWGSIPTAVIVDYAGDDAYETTSPFTQACGDMGVGILADLSGDDSYVGMKYTQGTGFCGIGMLIDEAGDDTYRGLQMHQAVGHWGAGILLDCAGRDHYESHCASQGVGLPGGIGLLVDGGRDGDSYYCKGDQQSGYGTDGVFEGWGQGMGFGYRPYASGGVGLAFDAGGADRMEAGNFSQGGGYFYGFGLLFSAGADPDHYVGSRYAQGFGCHQAAGCLIESGGDDRYTTRYAVAQGLSWDESTSLFLDEAGDDRYEGGSFSHCASANNGFALFLELGGDDTYLYTDQARAGGNDYHGGKSLSFFVDAGGGKDSYPKRPNDKLMFGEANSIFVDARGELGELAEDALRLKLAQPEPAK